MVPSLRYVAPFVTYLVGVTLIASFPSRYPVLYTVVVGVTALVSWQLLGKEGPIRPHRRVFDAVVVGLIGIVIWIGLCNLGLESRIASYLPEWLQPADRVGFDPHAELSGPLPIGLFVAVRLVGLAMVVPLVEEVFWRGFLLRWVISDRWQQVPLGAFQWKSFWVVTLLFAAAHPEWFAAAAYCALLNGFLYWKRDLWSCIVAHGVSNLALGIYVLTVGAWELW